MKFNALFLFSILAISAPLPAAADPGSMLLRRGADDGPNHDLNDDHGNHHNNGSNSSSSDDDSSDTDGEAKVERRVKLRRGIVQRDEFKANVEIPIPLLSAGIANLAQAAAADVQVHLARGGVKYAECQLSVDRLREETSSEAEYKTDLRVEIKKGSIRVRNKKGTCDTDLVTPGVQNGIPDLQGTDTAKVFVNDVEVPVRVKVRLRN